MKPFKPRCEARNPYTGRRCIDDDGHIYPPGLGCHRDTRGEYWGDPYWPVFPGPTFNETSAESPAHRCQRS